MRHTGQQRHPGQSRDKASLYQEVTDKIIAELGRRDSSMIRAFSSSLRRRRRSGPSRTSPRICHLSLRTSCSVQVRPKDDYKTGQMLRIYGGLETALRHWCGA